MRHENIGASSVLEICRNVEESISYRWRNLNSKAVAMGVGFFGRVKAIEVGLQDQDQAARADLASIAVFGVDAWSAAVLGALVANDADNM